MKAKGKIVLVTGSTDGVGASPEETLKAVESDPLKGWSSTTRHFFLGRKIRQDVRAEVMKRFPHTSRLGIFEVFWKE